MGNEHEQLVTALREALTDNSPNGWMLLQRVPLLCNDVRAIKNDLKWIRWLVIAIAGGIGMLALRQLGIHGV